MRLKRKNSTLFLHVEPTDTFHKIKLEAAEVLKLDVSKMGLFSTENKSKELRDTATVTSENVENDDIVYICMREGSEYEDVEGKLYAISPGMMNWPFNQDGNTNTCNALYPSYPHP